MVVTCAFYGFINRTTKVTLQVDREALEVGQSFMQARLKAAEARLDAVRRERDEALKRLDDPIQQLDRLQQTAEHEVGGCRPFTSIRPLPGGVGQGVDAYAAECGLMMARSTWIVLDP